MEITIEDLKEILNSSDVPDGMTNQMKGWIINRAKEKAAEKENPSLPPKTD